MIKVLHVEDDGDIREIAEMALSLSGEFDVTQCDCGESALSVAPDQHPDILLLDMMMPGMTGSETLIELRKISHMAHVPAVFMTARAEHAEIANMVSTGAADVIPKPFDPMTLGDQIKEILQRTQGLACA